MDAKNVEPPIRVIARCRPLLNTETEDKRKSIIQADPLRAEISIINGSDSEKPKSYLFDNAFSPETSQITLYNDIAFPIVDSVLQGCNGTIFAYGQTGAGKTHTIQGKIDFEEAKGIIPRAFEQIFNYIENTLDRKILVQVSFFEIYNELIYDLFTQDPRKPLQIRERVNIGVYVENLLSLPVENIADGFQKLQLGIQNRATKLTETGKNSSRSHTVFSITIESSGTTSPDGQQHQTKRGKLNLVDLAGSERISKTTVTGMRLQEASNAGKSLTALGNVISAINNQKSVHIPYRDSKLTRILQDSLGGITKAVLIANIGIADCNYEETISTLRYASMVKASINKPIIKEEQREKQEKIEQTKTEGEDKKQNLEDKRKMIEDRKDLGDAEKQKLLADLAGREEDHKVDNEDLRMNEVKKKLEEKVLIEQKLVQKVDEQKAELEEKDKIIDKLFKELQEAKTEIQNFYEEREIFRKQIVDLNAQLNLKGQHEEK